MRSVLMKNAKRTPPPRHHAIVTVNGKRIVLYIGYDEDKVGFANLIAARVLNGLGLQGDFAINEGIQ